MIGFFSRSSCAAKFLPSEKSALNRQRRLPQVTSTTGVKDGQEKKNTHKLKCLLATSICFAFVPLKKCLTEFLFSDIHLCAYAFRFDIGVIEIPPVLEKRSGF